MLKLRTLFVLLMVLGAAIEATAQQKAPDLSFKDINGKAIRLSAFRGKVLLLNFWATWCPPCVEEMPSLVEMQKKLKGTDVTVLAVSLDVDEGAYKKFIKDHGVDLVTVRDADQKSNALYGTYKFPETFVIDKNGVLRRKFIGAVDWNDPQIAPGNSEDYYRSVLRFMHDADQVRESYRLFMVPGMGHCGGGEGTSAFDMLSALEKWVEEKKPPERIQIKKAGKSWSTGS